MTDKSIKNESDEEIVEKENEESSDYWEGKYDGINEALSQIIHCYDKIAETLHSLTWSLATSQHRSLAGAGSIIADRYQALRAESIQAPVSQAIESKVDIKTTIGKK